MKSLITPTLGITLWSLSCAIGIVFLFVLLFKYVFKKPGSHNNATKTLRVIGIFLLGLTAQSCSTDEKADVYPTTAIEGLSKEFNLKPVTGQLSTNNALQFATVEEARQFLRLLR